MNTTVKRSLFSFVQSARDRGMVDSYYRRLPHPHFIVNDQSISVGPETPEYHEYMAGYARNEAMNDHKNRDI